MCKEHCGDRGFLWRSVGLPEVVGGETFEHKPNESNNPSTFRLICSTHPRADQKKLIEFQEEYCKLWKEGVPPQEIVRNWNDSQNSFWNKVYLVEEKP